MIYRIRIILDCDGEVFRDIEIRENSSFEDLHLSIINYFNFNGGEMASFYISDDSWKQGEEIMLENFTGNNYQMVMKTTKLNSVIDESNNKFIYIYDFLKLWTFYVEVFEIKEEKGGSEYPKNIFSNGNLPDHPPEKKFVSDRKTNEIFDDDDSDLYNDNFY